MGIDLISTDTHPIKATKLALDITKANEMAIENSKTGKVTAAATIMRVCGGKSSNSRNAILGKMLKGPYNRSYSKKTKKHLYLLVGPGSI